MRMCSHLLPIDIKWKKIEDAENKTDSISSHQIENPVYGEVYIVGWFLFVCLFVVVDRFEK